MIVVVHPGVQHSRELVRALHQGELLSRFVTSLDGGPGGVGLLPRSIVNRLSSRAIAGVPAHSIVTIPYFEIATWIARFLLTPRQLQRFSYAGLDLFDRFAARSAFSTDPRIVVGVENSCRHTFRRAKLRGVICVLDAASVHYTAQPSDGKFYDAALDARINAAKDEEVALADHIVVLSTYSRDTYLAAGVPATRISVVPPGIWLPEVSGTALHRERGTGIRFLFVGNVKHSKGVDLLLSAFARLDIPGKRLVIAGPASEANCLPSQLPPGIENLGKLDRRAVFEAYFHADVLVCPSRADGFGFVVAEAMSTGLPVIVSSATGAKDLVQDGVSGWIFPSGDEAALFKAMERAAGQRAQLDAVGARAKASVAHLTWDAYGERIRALYRGLLGYADHR